MEISAQARWKAKKRQDPEYCRKLREYYREYRKRRKEQDGIWPAQAYYNRKKDDPRFKAKRKKYNENRKRDPKWQEYGKRYYREVISPKNKERRKNDPEWAETQREANRLANAKRKADPITYAAYLAYHAEYRKKHSRKIAARDEERRKNDPEWREKLREKNKRVNEKRKADPVRYAAYLAKRREYMRQWKKKRKNASKDSPQ